jgi:hypothetical protein
VAWGPFIHYRYKESPRAISIIQGVSKRLGQTSDVSSSNEKKEKALYKHMSRNEWFFNLIEKLHSTINALNM